MKPAVFAALLAVALAACVSMNRNANSTAAESSAVDSAPPDAAVRPVIIELFTSQGCSSCPPADRLLTRLGSDARFAGRLIPLAYHVDYWNYIGWSDPFSAKRWTDRQYAYARALGLDGVYTPQIIVNGQRETVGSNESAIVADIAQAAAEGGANVHATAVFDGERRATVSVDVTAPEGVDLHNSALVVALFENGIDTEVRRGENSGRVLRNDYIVRRLEEVSGALPAAGASGRATVTLDVDPTWNRAKLGFAAFVQDRGTMQIRGAAVAQPR